MFADGTTQVKQVGLPARSRTTVGVNRALSLAEVCDGIALHPYDYPEYWSWYYGNLVDICARSGFPDLEVVVTEIGWPHGYNELFTPEGQRQAIGEVGVGGLVRTGCKKMWIFEDVDPKKAWDDVYDGLYDYAGNKMPAWDEYKKWQNTLPDYTNKPRHFPG